MEIYVLYNFVSGLFEAFAMNVTLAKVWGIVFGALAWSGLFTLQGIGLFTMAKKQGLPRRWLVFVPFANIYYMGKLAGQCHVFGQRVKRAGIYTMIAQILTTVFCGLMIAAEVYLYVVCGEPTKIQIENSLYYLLDWGQLTGFSSVVLKFYENGEFVLSIFQLIYEILMLILIMGLYKKYSPKNYMVLSFLELFVPISRMIVIFVLRNKTPIDYEAYMRARREAYMRRQQQYYGQYGNPYNNPYNNPYGNPYGNPYNQQPQQPPQKPEDPFEEFASDTAPNASEGQKDTNAKDGDDFFN